MSKSAEQIRADNLAFLASPYRPFRAMPVIVDGKEAAREWQGEGVAALRVNSTRDALKAAAAKARPANLLDRKVF